MQHLYSSRKQKHITWEEAQLKESNPEREKTMVKQLLGVK
jgi:hypothetical protein